MDTIMVMNNRIKELENMTRKLRKALYEHADPMMGWETVEAADTFEESKDLVPLNEEEKRFFND